MLKKKIFFFVGSRWVKFDKSSSIDTNRWGKEEEEFEIEKKNWVENFLGKKCAKTRLNFF